MGDCNNSNAKSQQGIGVIYKLTNLINGKKYIGQTIQKLSSRIYQHKHCETTAIGQAIKKYGWENFKSEIIEECPKNILDEREIFWISYYGCIAPKGYNLSSGGKVKKGKENNFYGKHHTKETRAKISARNKAMSTEQKEKISMTLKSKGIKPPSRKGCKLTEEHKAKISKAGKGRKCSEETKAKISRAHKGKKLTKEHKAKLSVAHKGKSPTKKLLMKK